MSSPPMRLVTIWGREAGGSKLSRRIISMRTIAGLLRPRTLVIWELGVFDTDGDVGERSRSRRSMLREVTSLPSRLGEGPRC